MKKISKLIIILILFLVNSNVSATAYIITCEAGNVKREGNTIIWTNVIGCYHQGATNDTNIHIATADNILYNQGNVYYNYECGHNQSFSSNSCSHSTAVNATSLGWFLRKKGNVSCPDGNINNCYGTGIIEIPVSGLKKYIFTTRNYSDLAGWERTVTLYKDISSCLVKECKSYTTSKSGTKHYNLSGTNTETGQSISANCNSSGVCTF